MELQYKKANDRFIKIMQQLISNKECENQKDFADILKITPSTISHIKGYTHNIPYNALFELHKEFGISIDYVLFNIGTPKLAQPAKNTIEDLIRRVIELERKLS